MADEGQTRIVPNQPVVPGTRLNGIFEIEEKIAAGGMGEVFRGRNIATSEPVAIKIVLPEFSRDDMIRELFFKEARVLGSLNHPTIVRYQMFTVEPVLGRPYLVMEYIEGCSLDEMIRKSRLTVAEVKQLFAKVADALEAAHQAGVVHRDLSPDNILLAKRNVAQPRIIDFGIARTLQAGGTILGNMFAGRENFASPEQYGLYGGNVTAASDVYSLGLVIAAALRGQALDMGGTQYDQIEKRRRIPDLDGIDVELQPALRMMLEPDPARRRLTMADIADFFTGRAPLPAAGAPDTDNPGNVPEPASQEIPQPPAVRDDPVPTPETTEEDSVDDIWALPNDVPPRPAAAADDQAQAPAEAARSTADDPEGTWIRARPSAWADGTMSSTADGIEGGGAAETPFVSVDRVDPFAEGARIDLSFTGMAQADTSRAEPSPLDSGADAAQSDAIRQREAEPTSIAPAAPFSNVIQEEGGTRIAAMPVRRRDADEPAEPLAVLPLPGLETAAITTPGLPPMEAPSGARAAGETETRRQSTSGGRPRVLGWLAGGAGLAVAAAAGLYVVDVSALTGIRLPWSKPPVAVAEAPIDDLLPPMNEADQPADVETTAAENAVRESKQAAEQAQADTSKTTPLDGQKKSEQPEAAAETPGIPAGQTVVADKEQEPEDRTETKPDPAIAKAETAKSEVKTSEPVIADTPVVTVEPAVTQTEAETSRNDAAPNTDTDAATVLTGKDNTPAQINPDHETADQATEKLPDAAVPAETAQEQSSQDTDSATGQDPVTDTDTATGIPKEEKATTPIGPDRQTSDGKDEKLPDSTIPVDTVQDEGGQRTDNAVAQDTATHKPNTETEETRVSEATPTDTSVAEDTIEVTPPAVDQAVIDARRKAAEQSDLLPETEPEDSSAQVQTDPVMPDVDEDAATDTQAPVTAEKESTPVDPAVTTSSQTTKDNTTDSEAADTSAALPAGNDDAQVEKPSGNTETAALPQGLDRPEIVGQPPSTPSDAAAWISGFDGGTCFFAEATEINGKQVNVASIAGDTSKIKALYGDFQKTFGFEPEMRGWPINDSQCQVTNLLNTLRKAHGADESRLKLQLEADEIRNGEHLRGEITRAEGNRDPILLLLIDRDGSVYNLTSRLKEQADGSSLFSQAIIDKTTKPADDEAFKVVLALSGTKALEGVSLSKRIKADRFIPQLIEAANQGRIEYAYGLFITAGKD